MSAKPANPTTTMRAVIYRRYGPPDKVLEVVDAEIPVAGDDEVLVRVRAAAVNPGDLFSLLGRPYVVRLTTGLIAPRRSVLGRAFSGTVEAVGGNVTDFRPADDVYGEVSGGAYAAYVSAAAGALARKPTNTTFEAAAAVPLSGVTALQGLRDKGRVSPGDRVLINGASGGVGTLAVQVARALGGEVTAVCSPGSVTLVQSLGADHIIDYTREDFTQLKGFDVVFDLVGNRSLTALRRTLAPAGTLVLSSGPPSPTVRRIVKALAISPFTSHRMTPLIQMPNRADLDYLTELVEARKVTPVIDRVFQLEAAADSLRYYREGPARGRTIITMDETLAQDPNPL